jgi:hypothetical protein
MHLSSDLNKIILQGISKILSQISRVSSVHKNKQRVRTKMYPEVGGFLL